MENNYIIFKYMAYIMLQRGITNFEYILDTDFSNLESKCVKNTKIINEDNFFEFINTDNPNNPNISKLQDNTNISLRGYFQYDKIYLQNKSYILDFIEQHKNVHKVRTDDETYLTKYIVDDMLLESSKR